VASNGREEAVEGDHANVDVRWISLSFIEENGMEGTAQGPNKARRGLSRE
jgi:hypothetical protein